MSNSAHWIDVCRKMDLSSDTGVRPWKALWFKLHLRLLCLLHIPLQLPHAQPLCGCDHGQLWLPHQVPNIPNGHYPSSPPWPGQHCRLPIHEQGDGNVSTPQKENVALITQCLQGLVHTGCPPPRWVHQNMGWVRLDGNDGMHNDIVANALSKKSQKFTGYQNDMHWNLQVWPKRYGTHPLRWNVWQASFHDLINCWWIFRFSADVQDIQEKRKAQGRKESKSMICLNY